MSLTEITDPKAVRAAIIEYDRIGEKAFLSKYGFGRARAYFLVADGKEYPSKAIAGVAHKYQFPKTGPLSSADFVGGYATVKPKLESLGFKIRVRK